MAQFLSIGIGESAGYVPEGRIDTIAAAARFGVTSEFINNKTGFVALARRGANETACDMAEAAVRALRDQVAVRAATFSPL